MGLHGRGFGDHGIPDLDSCARTNYTDFGLTPGAQGWLRRTAAAIHCGPRLAARPQLAELVVRARGLVRSGRAGLPRSAARHLVAASCERALHHRAGFGKPRRAADTAR